MNRNDINVLLELNKNKNYTQREIAKNLQISLGTVNKSIQKLKNEKYISNNNILENKAHLLIKQNKPKNAIILAAGLGLRMAPINHDSSKGMLVVHGKTIIENYILLLKEKGIEDIIVVVGFMKEQYEELIDKYNIKLIVNSRYHETNNIYSLYLVRNYIHNTYILPCDVYIEENIFSENEICSWYLLDKEQKSYSKYKCNRMGLVQTTNEDIEEKKLLSIAYINKNDSITIQSELNKLDEYLFSSKNLYWEDIFFKLNINLYIKFSNKKCIEINTYEDLRNEDPYSESLNSDIIDIIKNTLHVELNNIKNFNLMKKGMTNRSFTFEVDEDKYIMRIPGEGTDKLINRKAEGDVYHVISPYKLSDDVLYFNSENGYKITKYISNSRVCNQNDRNDLKKCMKMLKKYHQLHLQVNHTFDLFDNIEYYEKLRNRLSLYKDYDDTKKKIYELKDFIESCAKNWTLTHIDAVYDNFLIFEELGKFHVRLIDWEYAAMQDSDVDIAMFCIYALYDRKKVDMLIDIYYENNVERETRIKIYAYIAICGFLWSNWCEYKYTLGVEFGEYSLAQYRYAKVYYKIVMEELRGNENE